MSKNEALNALDTDELLFRVSNSLLTPEAHRIALEILNARKVPTENLPPVPSENENAIKSFGTESEYDKKLSKNSFLNFLLILVCPVALTIPPIVFVEIATDRNFFISLISLLLQVGSSAVLLKYFYNRFFKAEDKLNISIKVPSFVSALAIAIFFSVGRLIALISN